MRTNHARNQVRDEEGIVKQAKEASYRAGTPHAH